MMEYYPTLLEAAVNFRIVSRELLARHKSMNSLFLSKKDNFSCIVLLFPTINTHFTHARNTLFID